MPALPVPTTLRSGAYALESVIGQGGFGITYRAWDCQNEHAVAIKECFPAGCERCGAEVIAADFWAHSHFQSFQHRLRTQARQVSEIQHPHLARVLDCFDENATVYLVMELVEGPTLLDLIEEDEVSFQEAHAWIEKLGGALGALHQKGLLHLDVKPENIILRDDEPVLLDFDLVQTQGDADNSTRPLALAMQCGTPGYAPLEQYALTGKLSPATDIYALGATFYHLLTGTPPLSATDRAAGTPFLSALEIRSELAPHWDTALLRALEIKDETRPQSVTEWQELLKEPPPVVVAEEEEDYSPVMIAPQLMTHGTGVHRVVLTERQPVFPKHCVCCHAKPDTQWQLKSPSGRFELPLCDQCRRHQIAARASGVVTFWGSVSSLIMALVVVWASFVTSSLFPLLLGPFCIVINFAALSYGALKNSRAEEMLKNSCCNLSEPATYNFNGKVHIWRFKNAQFAADFKKKNSDFVV